MQSVLSLCGKTNAYLERYEDVDHILTVLRADPMAYVVVVEEMTMLFGAKAPILQFPSQARFGIQRLIDRFHLPCTLKPA